jgi:Fungal Zn(2)-Cys(6) binuclear cluster domain
MRTSVADTDQRPFLCTRCHRQFQRPDALRRHINKYCQARLAESGPAESGHPAASSRAHRACAACYARKIKCSGEQPCLHCESKGQPCLYHERVPRKKPPITGPEREAEPEPEEEILEETAQQSVILEYRDEHASTGTNLFPDSAGLHLPHAVRLGNAVAQDQYPPHPPHPPSSIEENNVSIPDGFSAANRFSQDFQSPSLYFAAQPDYWPDITDFEVSSLIQW